MGEAIGKIIGFIILIALVIFLGPWVVMTGWNMIAAEMFAAPVMSYWSAFFGTWALHIIFAGFDYHKKENS